MNREILFRGKRKSDGEWIFGNLLRTDDDGICIIQNHVPHHFLKNYEVDQETICQYTGLIDKKNDKKIFEGDICDFSVFDYNGHDTQYRGIVVYAGSKFVLWKSKDSEYYGADGGFDLDWTIAQDDEFEVVGNIFDNPELLDKAGELNGKS